MKFHLPNKAFSQAYRKFLFRPMGRLVLILTTIGRTTGCKLCIGLQYELIEGIYYVGAADGIRVDWYRNILKNPDVDTQAGAKIIPVVAEAITDEDKMTSFFGIPAAKTYLNDSIYPSAGWCKGKDRQGCAGRIFFKDRTGQPHV